MKPTGAMKEARVTEWTLSKPLTNQIMNNDLRKGLIGSMLAYCIDVPENEDVTHFAGVLVFGNEQRAKDIVVAINEHERLREALQLAAVNIDYLTNWIRNTYGGDNDDVQLGRAYAQRARAALNDATPSTSAGKGEG